jgi:hypothetical protein
MFEPPAFTLGPELQRRYDSGRPVLVTAVKDGLFWICVRKEGAPEVNLSLSGEAARDLAQALAQYLAGRWDEKADDSLKDVRHLSGSH